MERTLPGPSAQPLDGREFKVIIVTPDIVGPIKNGGIGTACFHYARSLANAGIGVDILFTEEFEHGWHDRWQQWYSELGIGFLSMRDIPELRPRAHGPYWYTERSWRVMNYLRDANYNYIIFQDWHANAFWTARARQMGAGFGRTPIGVIAHSPTEWQKAGMETFGNWPLQEADLEWCEKEAIAAADVLISPSHHMVEWLKAHGYPLPRVVKICPYTFEDCVVHGNPQKVDRNHLIFFGRLETRKGLRLLGDALRQMARDGDRLPSRVSLLGKYGTVDGRPAKKFIADLSDDLPSIEFVTHTEFDYRRAVEYIRQTNGVVVIASLLDNYPLTVLESITNGFCFVASAAGGIPEMIDPAVAFAPTAKGLQDLLRRLDRIDFSQLRHSYDPAQARTTWLEHVREVCAGNAPGVETTRPARVSILSEPVPAISVCIPFYRAGRYIQRLADAFLSMNLDRLQLVFVNDGSPEDELTEFVELRQKLEPAGHIFYSQDNAGPGSARNRAIELAEHDLLVLFDADNLPFPDMVPKLWKAMWRTNADSVAAPFVAVPPLSRAPTAEDIVYYFLPAGGSLPMALVHNTLGDTGSLIRRDVVRAVGGFRTTFFGRPSWEDWEFFLKVVSKGFHHLVYPEPLFYYTYEPGGAAGAGIEYKNRVSLLACLDEFDADVAVVLARILAKDLYGRATRDAEHQNHLEQQLDAVYRSGSWRITAPLRTVVGKAMKWMPASS